jgi:hypothetical protein
MLKEDKYIKKLFCDDLNVQPPERLHQEIRNRILRDKKSYEVKKSKKKVLYIAGSAVVAILLIFGSGFISPTMAEVLHNLPIVGVIYKDFESDIGLEKAKTLGLKQEYKQTVVSNNIELTLTGAYYDGSNLSIAYHLKNKGTKELKDGRFLILSDVMNEFKINGSRVYGGFDEKYKKLNPNEYEGNLYIYPIEFPKEENFTLELIVSEISGVKGDWKIKIPVTKEKVKGTVQTFTPNYKITALGGQILIKSISFTPTGIELNTETIMEKGKGQDIFFSIKEVGADNGVTGHTKDLGNGKELTSSRFTFSPIKKVPNSISIMAYSVKDSSQRVTFNVPLKK